MPQNLHDLFDNHTFNKVPFYSTAVNQEQRHRVSLLSWSSNGGGGDQRYLFNEWDTNRYAEFLSSFTGHTIDQLQPRESLIHTWMMSESEEFLPIDITEMPWRGVP